MRTKSIGMKFGPAMPVPTYMRLANVSAASSLVTNHRFSCDPSIPNVVDFEQPRALYTKVLNDTSRQNLVQNIAAHLGNVKSTDIKARQRKCFPLSHSHFLMFDAIVSRRIRRGRPRSLRCHRQGHRHADCCAARQSGHDRVGTSPGAWTCRHR